MRYLKGTVPNVFDKIIKSHCHKHCIFRLNRVCDMRYLKGTVPNVFDKIIKSHCHKHCIFRLNRVCDPKYTMFVTMGFYYFIKYIRDGTLKISHVTYPV